MTIVPRTGPLSASSALARTSWYQRGKSASRGVRTPLMARAHGRSACPDPGTAARSRWIGCRGCGRSGRCGTWPSLFDRSGDSPTHFRRLEVATSAVVEDRGQLLHTVDEARSRAGPHAVGVDRVDADTGGQPVRDGRSLPLGAAAVIAARRHDDDVRAGGVEVLPEDPDRLLPGDTEHALTTGDLDH